MGLGQFLPLQTVSREAPQISDPDVEWSEERGTLHAGSVPQDPSDL